MKNKKKIIGRRLHVAALILAVSVLLSSCSLSSAVGALGGKDSGTGKTPTGDTVVNNNQITVNSDGDGVEHAAAKGLRSAVSVYSSFKVTTGGNTPWNPRPTTQTYYSTGAGIVYKNDGGDAFIVTNFHVVHLDGSDSADGVSEQIYIYLYGMESEEYAIPATYVGGSAYYDIAVLRVEDSELLASAVSSGSVAAVSVADSDTLVPGMATVAIGNPSSSGADLGGISVTKGVVSVESEYIVMNAIDGSGEVSFRVIRTDTAVNSGNSGGGLFNSRGELIGIVNAKLNSSSYESIGYAIPSDVVTAVADNIIDNCFGTECRTVMRAVMGVAVEVSGMHTVYDPDTALITRVEEISAGEVTADGPANGLIKTGDVIKTITVGDKTVAVTRRHHVFDTMLEIRAGDTVTVTVERDGTEIPVEITFTAEDLVAN